MGEAKLDSQLVQPNFNNVNPPESHLRLQKKSREAAFESDQEAKQLAKRLGPIPALGKEPTSSRPSLQLPRRHGPCELRMNRIHRLARQASASEIRSRRRRSSIYCCAILAEETGLAAFFGLFDFLRLVDEWRYPAFIKATPL
jgi:hypothetical protein